MIDPEKPHPWTLGRSKYRQNIKEPRGCLGPMCFLHFERNPTQKPANLLSTPDCILQPCVSPRATNTARRTRVCDLGKLAWMHATHKESVVLLSPCPALRLVGSSAKTSVKNKSDAPNWSAFVTSGTVQNVFWGCCVITRHLGSIEVAQLQHTSGARDARPPKKKEKKRTTKQMSGSERSKDVALRLVQLTGPWHGQNWQPWAGQTHAPLMDEPQ